MRFVALALCIFLANFAFADKPVASARMGKVGSLHQNSWRISQEVDEKGEGENYLFYISIFKADVLCDYFCFTLNEGAKNTKKSQYSISGDAGKENFGSEVCIEFLSMSKEQSYANINLTLQSKIFDSITFSKQDSKAKVEFLSGEINNSLSLKLGSTLSFNMGNSQGLSIKIELKKEN